MENRKPDCDGRALANPAVQLHLSAVQLGATFHEKQAQPGSGARSGLRAAALLLPPNPRKMDGDA